MTEIDVFGIIGDYGLRAEDFKNVLDEVNTSSIIVNINSPGGDVFAGIAAYNLLVEHSAAVTVRVHGLAASAASLIAMAGDTVVMGEGSFLMIHNAWTIALGDTREMDKMAKLLKKIDGELAGVYSARTGISRDDVRAMMDAETWLTSDEAVESGFADEATADAAPENRADLSAYKNVPKALIKKKAPKKTAPAAKSRTPATDAFQRLIAAIQG